MVYMFGLSKMLDTRAKNRASNDNATSIVKYCNKGVNYLNFGHPECTKAKNLCDSKLFRAENAVAVVCLSISL